MHSTAIWKKAVAETIGTYFLVFAGTGAIIINDLSNNAITHVGVALTFGLIVFSMIQSIGNVSGCHINPAVSIALRVGGKIDNRTTLVYVVGQLIGAIMASSTLLLLFPKATTFGATLPAGSELQSFLLETILTMMLMFVVLRSENGSSEEKTVVGITIGAVIALEAMFAGPISGASMNPARSLGPALVSGVWTSLWVYLIAPVLGACLAIPLNQLLRHDES